MRRLLLTPLALLAFLSVSDLLGFSIRGKGENRPVVHSFFNGKYYLRSIPAEDYGTAGKTVLYEVGKEEDKAIDQYDVYMRGELFLGWLPLEGKFAVVQLEPVRITSADDFEKLGKVSRLLFYKGGKLIREYSQEDLAGLDLVSRTWRLTGEGDFTVEGVQQVPRTNHYRFQVTRRDEKLKPEILKFDISTGELADFTGAQKPEN